MCNILKNSGLYHIISSGHIIPYFQSLGLQCLSGVPIDCSSPSLYFFSVFQALMPVLTALGGSPLCAACVEFIRQPTCT